MSNTVTLVHQGNNHIRYLVVGTAGGTATITTTGAATPDLITDSLAGPIKNLANAFANGYGKLAAGALTQAQARALWLSDDPTNVVGNVPKARITATKRSGDINDLNVDADVSTGHPVITVTGNTLGSAASFYVDIEIDDVIGD